jgi:hypothetical protein
LEGLQQLVKGSNLDFIESLESKLGSGKGIVWAEPGRLIRRKAVIQVR